MKLFLLISLSLLTFIHADYDPNLARNKMLALSAAAYSNQANIQLCLTNALKTANIINQYTVSCGDNKTDTCSGFTAVSHADQAIILAFRGSSGFLQLITEADDTIFDSQKNMAGIGMVSEYFYNAWNAIWLAGMQSDLLTQKNNFKGYQLWVTGHSLGGAMASITSVYVALLGYFPPTQITLYTMGQPRTGDSAYSAKHDILVPNSYRITHKYDLVPHVPLEYFENYYHHKNEIFYDNDMTQDNFITCLDDESDYCSDGNLLDMSITDHLHYFGKYVSKYGECGCAC